jgi:NAD(P)H-dependent FMN reductase
VKLKLTVVIASVREERVGPSIAKWFVERARAHGQLELEVVDLKELALPLLDEPQHPRLRQYKYEHTKRWSAIVDAADAYVFVTPEYNFGSPPALVNAVDYVLHEWAYKPAGFVSYGGVSGGLRSVQMTKQLLTSVKVMPIPEAVTIPFFRNFLGPDGAFAGGEANDKAAGVMLDELVRWASALAPLRAARPT